MKPCMLTADYRTADYVQQRQWINYYGVLSQLFSKLLHLYISGYVSEPPSGGSTEGDDLK